MKRSKEGGEINNCKDVHPLPFYFMTQPKQLRRKGLLGLVIPTAQSMKAEQRQRAWRRNSSRKQKKDDLNLSNFRP